MRGGRSGPLTGCVRLTLSWHADDGGQLHGVRGVAWVVVDDRLDAAFVVRPVQAG
jgi:hypothetical protein